MSALLKRYPLASALAILAIVLVAVLALEVASGASIAQRLSGGASSRPAVIQTKLLPTIAAANPEQEYSEFAGRPLFTPTRRPAPPQAVAGGPATMAKGQFTLAGVTIAGETRIALLREKSSGRTVRVEQGKEVNGITVAKIEPDQVTLAQAGDQEVVPMLVSKAAAPPAGMPVPAAPAAGPFAPPPGAAPPVQPGANPVSRPANAPAAQPPAPAAQPPLFGPGGFGPFRAPGAATPQPSPVQDPTTATPPVSQAAPLTPEELLARRRARRNQQTQ
jgi:hypothetical protein